MHSRVGPWEEARAVYVAQAGLPALWPALRAEGREGVVHDVGLGLAANALAAIEAALAAPEARLRVESFETRPEGLARALEEGAGRLPFLAAHAAKARRLLVEGEWASDDGRVAWRLHRGPYLDRARDAPPADRVFYDLYAPKSCPELWSPEAFAAAKAALRSPGGLLITYSAATPVRVAMLLAGLRVGHGAGTSAKSETTLAAPDGGRLEAPLGARWLERFGRSGRRVPYSWQDGRDEPPGFEAAIRSRVAAEKMPLA